MTSNVLPLFWHLASSSRDIRLTASADLVSSVEAFQQSFAAARADAGPSSSGEDDEGEDNESEDGEESGMEVDESDEEDEGSGRASQTNEEDERLERILARNNAQDVVYCLKRLVRGLGSSRESSRLGFAVTLTELLARTPTVTAAQALSLVIRNSQWANGGKGSDERDLMFARLFGLVALIDSGSLYALTTSHVQDFIATVDALNELARAKVWLAESAGWVLVRAVRALIDSEVAWKDEALEHVLETVYREDKSWTPEKISLTLLLQAKRARFDWKALCAPTFKHTPLLAGANLVTLGRVLKESGAGADDDEEATARPSGSWKPQLHFVWDHILAIYFTTESTSSDHAPFQDFFRVVVDESLFSNTSSAERKYWGFQVFERALPLLAPTQTPLVFTPNFMRCWMNNLSSSDRHLHKAALQTARVVQDAVSANPAVGFTLLSQLVGKHGRPDFDKATKTKTVESILASLTSEGVAQYVTYLQGVVLGKDEQNGTDAAAIDDRRLWALDQILALCRNGAVPKTDAWIAQVLDFLLVHGFFIVRKTDKKSPITTLHTIPKPAFSEPTAVAIRARFASCIVEVTAATPAKVEGVPSRLQGANAAGKLWLSIALDTVASLEANHKHAELVSDADDEIKTIRADALKVLNEIRQVKGARAEVARGVEILISFMILQTYDEIEDALDMLEEAVTAAHELFTAPTTADVSPVDALLDVLIALLDKGSSDLRSLSNLVFSMIAPALTASSIQHLVAQLEHSAADTAVEADGEEEDEFAGENIEKTEDEDESESDESVEEEEDDDDDTADVDPEFRRRVAEALQVSGMGVDGAVDENDSDEESEAWDDEQMMKVDEQLAEVFRQQASTSKRTDLKHLQIESLHFKNRVLDFFDELAHHQSSNPLVLDILVPLLRLVRSAGGSEGELANKAAGVLRTRIAKAAHVPTTVDSKITAKVLADVHELARKATSAEFSALCSSTSLFVSRAADANARASSTSSSVSVEAYRATLADFMTRKSSLVHPAFILDFVRRHPSRAWGLAPDLADYVAPGASVNAYRQTQAYAMLQLLANQLPAIAKEVPIEEVIGFVSRACADVYTTLEAAAGSGDAAQWKADRLKEVVKFSLQLARVSRNLLPEAQQLWDMPRLVKVTEAVKTGQRTRDMKSVHGLLQQLASVLGQTTEKKKKANGATTTIKPITETTDKANIDDLPVPKKRKAGAEDVKVKVKTGKKAKAIKTKA